ncbi:hypothetical protein [Metabacillus litoralis]|uniref:hypothetical protein n=1 Tax=Metabacillus litoralis TaxID=152268 RepID=UPI00203E69F1|nr:hypothetical protein [Metabacillus litoralis]MCM3654819.1 hypothetical protein [Metabacillus litoralis]
MNCGKSYIKRDNDPTIFRHLLEHTDQRFRLSYLLGNLTPKKSTLLRKFSHKTKSTTEHSIIQISPEERKQMEESLLNIHEY